jgi:hypothetical protein
LPTPASLRMLGDRVHTDARVDGRPPDHKTYASLASSAIQTATDGCSRRAPLGSLGDLEPQWSVGAQWPPVAAATLSLRDDRGGIREVAHPGPCHANGERPAAPQGAGVADELDLLGGDGVKTLKIPRDGAGVRGHPGPP